MQPIRQITTVATVLWLFGWAAPPQVVAQSPGARLAQTFQTAKRAFENKQYEASISTLNRILQRYPAHEPSMILMARSLYAMERMREALAFYARLNPQFLAPEVAYEFGWVHYLAERYQPALFAFRRIPADHTLYDLANYYGGLTAIKLEKFRDAEAMLERALALPPKLTATRQLHLKHVREVLLLRDKAFLERQKKAEAQRLAKQNRKPPPHRPAAEPNAPMFLTSSRAAVCKPGRYHGRQHACPYVALAAHYQNQVSDDHGYAETIATETALEAKGVLGARTPLTPRHLWLGGSLTIGGEQREASGLERRFVFHEETPDIIRTQSMTQGKGPVQKSKVGVLGFVEAQTWQRWWSSAFVRGAFELPEHKAAARSGEQTVGARLGLNLRRNAQIDLMMQMQQFVRGADNTQTKNRAALLFAASIGWMHAELLLRHDLFAYQDTALSGPDSASLIRAEAAIPLAFKTLLRLASGAEQQVGNLRRGLPTFGDIAADGFTTFGKLSLVGAPLTWLKFELAHLQSRTDWAVTAPTGDLAQNVYERNVANFFAQQTATVAVYHQF